MSKENDTGFVFVLPEIFSHMVGNICAPACIIEVI